MHLSTQSFKFEFFFLRFKKLVFQNYKKEILNTNESTKLDIFMPLDSEEGWTMLSGQFCLEFQNEK